MKRLLLVVISLFMAISINHTMAMKSEDPIKEFCNTCQLENYESLSYSQCLNVSNVDNNLDASEYRLVLSNSKIIGILIKENDIFDYIDLSNKVISQVDIDNIKGIILDNDDIIICLPDAQFSLIENDFVNCDDSVFTIVVQLDLTNFDLQQSRSGSRYLSVPLYQQPTNYTCWATCISSLAKFKVNTYVEPSRISLRARLNPNAQFATLEQTRDALTNQFNISCTACQSSLSASTIINQINSSKPIIAGFVSGLSGHMILVRGYSEGASYFTISYMDPATATYRTTQIATDGTITFHEGYKTFTNTCYIRLN